MCPPSTRKVRKWVIFSLSRLMGGGGDRWISKERLKPCQTSQPKSPASRYIYSKTNADRIIYGIELFCKARVQCEIISECNVELFKCNLISFHSCNHRPLVVQPYFHPSIPPSVYLQCWSLRSLHGRQEYTPERSAVHHREHTPSARTLRG